MPRLRSIALMVETRDPYTTGHQERVSHLAQAIAKEMGFNGRSSRILSAQHPSFMISAKYPFRRNFSASRPSLLNWNSI